MRAFSSCLKWRPLSVVVLWLLVAAVSLVVEHSSRHMDFSSCSSQAQELWLKGSRARAQKLWRTGLVALQSMGSSRTKDRTRVPCSDRWILNHWTTREFSSVAQSCPTLCDPMDCSTPGFPVRHQLPELTQTHVRRVGDAIQPSHPLTREVFIIYW